MHFSVCILYFNKMPTTDRVVVPVHTYLPGILGDSESGGYGNDRPLGRQALGDHELYRRAGVPAVSAGKQHWDSGRAEETLQEGRSPLHQLCSLAIPERLCPKSLACGVGTVIVVSHCKC